MIYRYRLPMIVLLITIILPLNLAWLYEIAIQNSNLNTNVAVFTTSPQPITINEQQLVHYLSTLPLQLRLNTVSWQAGKLELDLKVVTPPINPQIIYADINDLLCFVFIQTSNINRLQLRIVMYANIENKKHVLLAMDILRSSFGVQQLKQLQNTTDMIPTSLQHSWRIIYTPLWKKFFSNRKDKCIMK